MKQLFKSEITGKVYESEKECLEAEEAHNALVIKKNKEKEERKEEADKIKSKYEEYLNLCTENKKKETEVYNEYLDLRNKFVDKYGSYHLTISSKDDLKPLADFEELSNFVSTFFNSFWDF